MFDITQPQPKKPLRPRGVIFLGNQESTANWSDVGLVMVPSDPKEAQPQTTRVVPTSMVMQRPEIPSASEANIEVKPEIQSGPQTSSFQDSPISSACIDVRAASMPYINVGLQSVLDRTGKPIKMRPVKLSSSFQREKKRKALDTENFAHRSDAERLAALRKEMSKQSQNKFKPRLKDLDQSSDATKSVSHIDKQIVLSYKNPGAERAPTDSTEDISDVDSDISADADSDTSADTIHSRSMGGPCSEVVDAVCCAPGFLTMMCK